MMASFWVIKTISVSVCLAGHRLSDDHPPARGRATAPRQPHTTALGVAKEERPAPNYSRRGEWKDSLLRTGCFVPKKGGGPLGREGVG